MRFDDLGAWRRWQRLRHPARLVKSHLRERIAPATEPTLAYLTPPGREPDIVVAIDATSPSHAAAVLDICAALPHGRVGYLTSGPRPPGTAGWRSSTAPDDLDDAVAVTVTDYLPAGAAATRLARRGGRPLWYVQHGLLTPFAPPLPSGARLLAWSGADSDFWRDGRADVEPLVVGSQLLWRAARSPGDPVDPDVPAVWLGQLHAAELSRVALARAAGGFCRRHGARYRPHPSETDVLSRLQHRVWAARGIEIDRSGEPLVSVAAPVVASFSSGVVEAAAAGRPAWVHHPGAPAWLGQFWRRYRMAAYGGEPTPPPEQPATQPALAAADAILDSAGD